MMSSRPSTISSESDQIQVQTKPTVVSMLISVSVVLYNGTILLNTCYNVNKCNNGNYC